MMRKFLSVAGAIIAISLASPSAARAETNALIVLDNSNSMWGQVDGINKIVTARQVLEDFLRQLPGDVNVGLLAYGFNRKADCSDIEVVTSVAPGNAEEIIDRAKRMLPKGKSPIADALRMSPMQFPDTNANNNIVLFSDGVETCGGDACQVAADIAAQYPGMRVHVVGFDVTAEERSVLQCIAEASGGRYFHSSDAQELIAAIGEAPAEAIAEEEPEPLAAESEPEPLLAEPAPVEGEPEPLAAEGEPEPLAAEGEPEPLVAAAEPEPEPLAAAPVPTEELPPEFLGNDRVYFVNVDKARLIKLDRDVGSIHIAQPTLADVVVQSKRQVYVIGRFPGITTLYILDEDGDTLFQREIVVTQYRPQTAPMRVTVYAPEKEAVIVPVFNDFTCSPRCEPMRHFQPDPNQFITQNN